MTTIAWDGETIAADSQDNYTDFKTLSSQKLFRFGEEIIATAGHGTTGMLFIDWYEGDQGEVPRIDADDDFDILVWNKDGLFNVDRYFRLMRVSEPFFAIGCGACVALGAMHMGANAKQAVEVAKKVDLYTGGKVKVMTL
jgi:hypothetical protein